MYQAVNLQETHWGPESAPDNSPPVCRAGNDEYLSGRRGSTLTTQKHPSRGAARLWVGRPGELIGRLTRLSGTPNAVNTDLPDAPDGPDRRDSYRRCLCCMRVHFEEMAVRSHARHSNGQISLDAGLRTIHGLTSSKARPRLTIFAI